MQALVLRFDYKSSAFMENLQKQAVNAAGMSGPPLPPHLSLLTLQHADSASLKRVAEDKALHLNNTFLSFSSIGFFKQNGRFFLSPAASKALMDAHFKIQSTARGYQGHLHEHEPEEWTPHVPIITGILPPFQGPMFARLSMEFEPFKAKAAAIECWTLTGDHIETDWSLFLD
ncbi:2'-5' RNA ligase family protein [Planococcus lenghuensis]|uniref:2'-5' RNA ligase family protein n=1 Tax=Planococcus lenghuensis TaxID=2213202 RepID=A0A1Q2L0A4_9BACL|nr:2'-5' RNA ligase family protein [Planococcus lenghuensis]AQQ53885.1 hypothetical protein B0X71_12820 [Planococcus lenghuensis]